MAQQPLNNLARVAIETLVAVLGGVQTIATSSYDEAYAIPTEGAATLGEICEVLRGVYGVYKSNQVI